MSKSEPKAAAAAAADNQYEQTATEGTDASAYDWSQYYAQQGYDYSQYSGYYDQSQQYYYDPSTYDQTAYNNYYYPSAAASSASTPSYADTPPAPKEGLPEPISIEELNRVSNRGGASKKQPKIVRSAGGETWEDATLADWDSNDYRLFAGDLGPEVDDDMLTRAFSKYPSFQKAKVVMDKRAVKSKGYGFVSFKDADDFVKAWREMNGKYVGNRPIKLRKSTWKDRNMDVRAKKQNNRAAPYSKIR
ncbi:hypothetical protein INT43_002494 [Umbelopsis isabellina]|uniref:RRM domain-containing protein n=1 Tax=Mortierella isabellina TaxID=91625 RepID=A0A8H7Q594_MORIS|nr:hypothetical protein INT43_002494 [Umbelopsis isabellina]